MTILHVSKRGWLRVDRNFVFLNTHSLNYLSKEMYVQLNLIRYLQVICSVGKGRFFLFSNSSF